MNQPTQYPIGTTYHVTLTTGLITGIAAGTSSAGHIGSFRWSSASEDVLIHRVTAVWSTTVAFTTAQEVGMDLFATRSFTVDRDANVGDVAADFTGNNGKLWTKASASAAPTMSVSGTAALSGGTFTLDAQSLDRCQMYELAAAGTPYLGRMSLLWVPPAGVAPLRLSTNEGLTLRNTIAMGAAGKARVTLSIDYSRLTL